MLNNVEDMVSTETLMIMMYIDFWLRDLPKNWDFTMKHRKIKVSWANPQQSAFSKFTSVGITSTGSDSVWPSEMVA